MHQCAFTLYVFSAMLRSTLDIRNVITVNIPTKPPKKCCEMELNPSKDRDVHKGDYPSF
jgi:hypothetical protein